jgi:hypothetical protein
MTGGKQLADQIEIDLRNNTNGELLTIYIDVFDSGLSRKWLRSLNQLLESNYHLEKNYCFFGFVEHARNAEYICEQINTSIAAINTADLGYRIIDHFTVANTIVPGEIVPGDINTAGDIIHDKMNQLHRYFEDLQGVSGRMSPFYDKADAHTRWHIRQLNLLCHEYESLVLSMRKAISAPEWRRPSQLMCWLNAPRFVLEADDFELFGIDTINRSLGGVYVGVNKAVGKHHWEVFNDEGRDSRIDELTTSTLKSQTEAAGDFDIEWANDPGAYHWQQAKLAEFHEWLINNNFDPTDKSLTIGHPKVAQVDLTRSFGSTDYEKIWAILGNHLNVYKIRTDVCHATYEYNWSDHDFAQRQIERIQQGN